MKLFTKLALVSSIVAVSANAMAMQALDDKALSAATGQSGITIGVDTTSGIQIGKVLVHDEDGFQNQQLTFGDQVVNTAGTEDAAITAGAITINNLTINKAAGNTGNLATLTIDAADVAGNAVLNVLAETGALDIGIGSIGVGKSGEYQATGTAANTRGVVAGSEKEVISGLNIALGATKANIQLGSAPQGAMIVVDSDIVGGLTASLNINDTSATGGGSIGIDNLKLTTAGTQNLNADAKINVTNTGLKITTSSAPMNAYMNGLTLGNGTSIGAVEVQGINVGGTSLTISGH